MADTWFKVPADQQHRLADAYAFHPKDRMQGFDGGARSRWAKDRSFHSGGGGLASTLADYHSFCLMLLGGGQLGDVRIICRSVARRVGKASAGTVRSRLAQSHST